MMREVVKTTDAPQPVGPYSQAISIDRMIFCSGQIGLEPSSGRLVGSGVAEQAKRCLVNLEAILAAAGCSLKDVVKTTIFVTDMATFKEVNDVYALFFPDDPPARSTVAVAALPLGAKVEIEAIALRL